MTNPYQNLSYTREINRLTSKVDNLQDENNDLVNKNNDLIDLRVQDASRLLLRS